jgi:CHAD domain-containing protein
MTAERLEIELKYRVGDPAAATRLAAARTLGPFRAAGPGRQVQIEDRYLDTAEGSMARAGYAVRLRRGPTMTVVSVKSTTPAATALHRREELEGPADLSLDPHAWAPSAARSLVLEHAGEAPLTELVTVRQLRRTRVMADEAAEVELSIDEVEVVAGGRVVDRFVELEAELRRGPAAALEALGAALSADPDLVPETQSKLERALAAASRPRRSGARGPRRGPDDVGPQADGLAPAPVAPVRAPDAAAAVAAGAVATSSVVEPERAAEPTTAPTADAAAVDLPGVTAAPTAAEAVASPAAAPADAPSTPAVETSPATTSKLVVGKSPGVTADDVLAEAGRKVLRFHFARMLAKEAGTRSGKDIEDLHGMRVATRRMRAAWRVYGDAFRPSRTRRIRTRLRVLAGRLGAVRDLDVLIAAAEAHQAALGAREAAAFEPLVASWRAERDVARTVLIRELDGVGYVRLVEEYRVFVATEGAGAVVPASPVTPHRVRDTAGSRIWLAYEQVRAYETVLRWADVETIHQLRIASKWLRYTMEFFREALGPEADTLIARVVALQDHLGLLHDADVTIALTRQFLVAHGTSLTRDQSRAISSYLALQERELARLRRTMTGPWRGVSGPTFRRLLGRAVAAL